MSRDPKGRFEITVEGQLIEVRVFSLKSLDDANDYAATLGAQVMTAAAPVLLADHRPVVIYPQNVASRLVDLFTKMNERLARAAIVAARTNATMLLQLERLVREAASAKRRVFVDVDQAAQHLAPALTATELSRARAFLASFSPP